MDFANIRATITKSLLLIISVLLLMSALSLAKDDDKTGYEEKGVFHDNRYDYSFELPKDWKIAKTFKDPESEPASDRVIAVCKKVRVPVKLQGNRELVQRPTMLILIDSTQLAAREFFQQIASSYELDPYQDAIVSRTILLQRGAQSRPEILESLPTKVAGHDAIRWLVRLEYAHQLETSFGPQLVRDWKKGHIYLVPLDGMLMYIEQVCENQSFETIESDFSTILNSLTFESISQDETETSDSSGESENKEQ
jgi:hypothetical protein